jgi:alkanesulfonate monooxygenase SsuD/methylene tetrahydromethanopterin reductase-like flavin-dependent oxidoreductase (luciferase family)
MGTIGFGIFDHIDKQRRPLGATFEDRLRLLAAAEAAGFTSYHLAEHHATPLCMAPSPNLFLAALAQRTRRLRFGPQRRPASPRSSTSCWPAWASPA